MKRNELSEIVDVELSISWQAYILDKSYEFQLACYVSSRIFLSTANYA
jgi:FixJ family two-component response regulator